MSKVPPNSSPNSQQSAASSSTTHPPIRRTSDDQSSVAVAHVPVSVPVLYINLVESKVLINMGYIIFCHHH